MLVAFRAHTRLRGELASSVFHAQSVVVQDEIEAEPTAGGVSCLAWTTSPFDTAMMVIGGSSNTVKVSAQLGIDLALWCFPTHPYARPHMHAVRSPHSTQ